jgi:allantoinase
MPTARQPGMDHAIYPYSPMDTRPVLSLPGGKPVAVYIVLQIEHWELRQPAGAYRDPRFRGDFGSYDPDYRAWSMRAYGNRVGLYRILELFDRLKLPVTAAVGAGALEAHPEIASALLSRNYEIVAHGLTVNRMITSAMSEEDESRHIAQSRAAIVHHFGRPPRGWLGQDFGITPRTSRMLADQGFDYTLDWANDEQPYLQEGGRLVAAPAPSDWDDVQTHAIRRVPIDRFPGLVADGIDELARSGVKGARAMAIGVHPWMMGAPHRFGYLKAAMEALLQRQDVLLTTAGFLADLLRAPA